jgi:hypothetical protein
VSKIYADAQGRILQYLAGPLQEQQFPAAPPGGAITLDFDPSTNAATIAALSASTDGWTCPNGVLTSPQGQATTIAAPSADYQTRALIGQVLTALSSGQFQGANVTASQANAAWTAIQAGTATAAQQSQFLVFFARLQALALKRLLANGTL